MVELARIQAYMRAQAEEDGKTRYIQATGDSLAEALAQAAIELGLPVKGMEYEVLERGMRGAFGFGRKKWLIVAYAAKAKDQAAFADGFNIDFGFGDAKELEPRDRDGEACVRLSSDGVYLSVSPPKGRGRPLTEREAVERISERFTGRFDSGLVSKIVRHADNEFVRIADYDYNPAHDPVMSVDITDFEMKAFLVMTPPGHGGGDPSRDAIVSFLQSNGVVHGLKDEVIDELERRPGYRRPVLVAEGTKPQNGSDASVIYNFETDKSRVKLKEKAGRVDFKELNLIQNVVEGQVLAKIVPPGKGESGRTVTGKLLPAKDGREVEMAVGKNVRLSADGSTALADINGQVVISGDRINVEPILVVAGDVNLKTGNILFLGTVMVKGNVEDGFSVKAAGNIEVIGSVGRCDLDAEGDIIVHQGITGKNLGKIVCGRSVWSKFIENAHVEAGELVVVSDGIINSEVFANRKVICKGRRASIVGGRVRAADEINAKALGSVGGSETICEVGYDPKSKEKLELLEAKREELDKQLEDIKLNLGTLEAIKKNKQTLPDDKQQYHDELAAKKSEILSSRGELDTEIESAKTYLSQLKIKGRIACSGTAFPGVKILIKDAYLEVKNEFKAVSFISEANVVKVTRYQESEEDLARKA